MNENIGCRKARCKIKIKKTFISLCTADIDFMVSNSITKETEQIAI